MAEYNLFHKIVPYLDKHLLFPLLEFMSNDETYDQSELNEHKLKLLQSTNMIDYAIEIYHLINKGDTPQDFLAKRKEVLETLKQTKSDAEAMTSILENSDATELIAKERDYHILYEKLGEQFNFKPTMIDNLYKLARLHYECGNYKYAAINLDSYLSLIPMNHSNFLSALWGKLASDILSQDWDFALNELKQLKENIDNRVITNPMQSLQERTWLLHWSLYIYFNHADGRDYLIDLFLYQAPYLNVIQTVCPHLLRYLTAAVITSKRKKSAMKDLVKVIKQESYAYTDPLIEFIECLFVECDFEKAQKKMAECEKLLDTDFFLVAIKDECMESIRQLTFEKYCRIHQCLSLSVIAERLNMSLEEAEQWIMNLIRTTRMDAKIDYKKGHIIMGTQIVPPYQKMIDKAKTLAYHTHYLANLLDKRIAATAQPSVSTYTKNTPYWANP